MPDESLLMPFKAVRNARTSAVQWTRVGRRGFNGRRRNRICCIGFERFSHGPGATLLSSTLVSSAENFGQCLGGYAVPAQLQPPSHGSADTQDDPRDRLITAELDRLTGKRDGQIQLQGNVLIREGQRLLQAQSALLDQEGSEIRFPQGLLVTQSNLVVAGEQAKIGLQKET